VTALEIVFWVALGLIVYSQIGYPLVLFIIRHLLRFASGGGGEGLEPGGPYEPPLVTLIVAAHNEQDVIADKVADALALDYPREKLEIVVASDGSTDATAERARSAGADLVLELPRGGKVAAQNAGVERASGQLLAFSDANSAWEPGALTALVAAFGDPDVGYACGRLQLSGAGGDNQEGLYWRYEMKLREMESGLAGVTAGNGAIYMTRRESYIELDPARSHDGSFPFMLAKRGLRSLDVPGAVATEPMAPSIGDEFARKRRIMRPLWDVVVLDGMLSPRGYSPLYAFEIFSHRLLRYAAPLLHLIAFAANIVLLGEGTVYAVTLVAQLAVLAGAALASVIPIAPFRIARYYVSVTASVIVGLWDRFRQGPRSAGWETVR
jgi:cellulose synthase/poly-beta-1,6-N-acetylglucosamine synthase-like glycosyltransferase